MKNYKIINSYEKTYININDEYFDMDSFYSFRISKDISDSFRFELFSKYVT